MQAQTQNTGTNWLDNYEAEKDLREALYSLYNSACVKIECLKTSNFYAVWSSKAQQVKDIKQAEKVRDRIQNYALNKFKNNT